MRTLALDYCDEFTPRERHGRQTDEFMPGVKLKKRNSNVVRRETGKEQRVRVPDSEGLANHVVPKSCVRTRREAHHEALTGVRVGQPSSRERIFLQGADAVTFAEGNMVRRVIASARLSLRGLRPWHARMLLAREPGDLQLDRWCQYGLAARIGKVRSRSR